MSNLKIGLLLSYICIASISAAIITPALPHIEQTYSLSHGALEWVVSIFLLGYVIGQLIYAPLANRFGRLSALRSGLIVNLAGIMLCIVSVWFGSYGLLLLGRLVTALGAAAGLSCTFILLNELLDKEKAKQAISFAVVSFTVGIGLAVTLGGFMTQYSHWQNCFWLLFFHGVVMLCFTWQFPETLKQPMPLHPRVIFSKYRSALKSYRLFVFSLAVGTLSAISYCYTAAAPLYTQSVLKLTPAVYGGWNVMTMLGMLTGGFVSAYLMKLYGARRTLLLGFGLTIPGLLSLILLSITSHPTVLWFFITTMSLYLFGGLIFSSASFFASNAIDDKANASSTMSFINMASATISVAIMGYLPFRTIVAFTVTVSVFFLVSCVLSLRCMMKDASLV